MDEKEAATPHNIAVIQVLRWVAATLVVVAHAFHQVEKMASHRGEDYPTIQYADLGIGVDIFFVISGFLMLHVSRRLFGAPKAATIFLFKRFLRIVPLYWITTSLMLLAMMTVPSVLHHSTLEPFHIVASYLMLAWPNPAGEWFPVLALGWTLNFEMYFYLVFSATLFMTPLRATIVASVYLLATVIIGSLWTTSGFFEFYSQPIVIEFAVGQILALLYFKLGRMGLLGALLLTFFAIAWHITAHTFHLGPRVFANGVPAALVFTAWVFGPRHSGTSYAGRLAQKMGDASYSLYHNHPFVHNAAGELARRAGVGDPYLLIVVMTSVSLLASVVVYNLVESPLTRALQRFAPKTPRPRSEAVATI